MDSIERNVLYLRGLIDGACYASNSKEGMIFNAVADSLEAVCDELEVLRTQISYDKGVFSVSDVESAE